MTKIKCIKEYPMVGINIKAGVILTKIPSAIGRTSYKDGHENTYTFDNSEIVFSSEFRNSFVVVK